MNTPNEKALRLIAAELKAMRIELKATRSTQGRILAMLTELGGNVKGLQVALSEREHDFEAKHEELGQRAQTTHERVVSIDRRVERVERAVKLRPA